MKALPLLIFQAWIRYKSRGVGSIIIQRNYQYPPAANGLADRHQSLIKRAYLFDNLELAFVFINFNLISV